MDKKYQVKDLVVPKGSSSMTPKQVTTINKQQEIKDEAVANSALAQRMIDFLDKKIAHYKSTDAVTEEMLNKEPKQVVSNIRANKQTAKELEKVRNHLQLVISTTEQS